MANDSRNELGDFLRSRRERLRPEREGLPAGGRRRTPGLRREEVAQLAGIGVDWYIRLEQGRSVTPSSRTVDALARVLHLDGVEHAHLRELARPTAHRVFFPERLSPALRRFVENLKEPAYVTGRRWDIHGWNKAADEIFAFSRLDKGDRNILIHMLTSPSARRLFGTSWAQEAIDIISQFRTTHDLWAGNPAFTSLLRRLREGCPEFSTWWKYHDIRGPLSTVKALIHPKKGLVRYMYMSFQAHDTPWMKLVIYLPTP